MAKNGSRGQDYPIVLIDSNIKVYMNHYNDYESAKNIWKKRCSRMNHENIIYMCSIQNADIYNEIKDIDSKKTNIYATSPYFSNSKNLICIDEWEANHHQLATDDYWRAHNRCADYKHIHSTPLYLTKMLLKKPCHRREYYRKYSGTEDIDEYVQLGIINSGNELKSALLIKKRYSVAVDYYVSSEKISDLIKSEYRKKHYENVIHIANNIYNVEEDVLRFIRSSFIQSEKWGQIGYEFWKKTIKIVTN